MKIKRCAIPLMLLLVVSGTSRLPGQAVDATAIAPDTTQAFLRISNVTQLETDWKQTGLYRLWTNAQTQQFVKPLIDHLSADLDAQEALQATEKLTSGWNTFKELFPGEVVAFISNADFLETTSGFLLDVCIAGKAGKEIKDYDALHSVMWSDMPADAEKSTFEVAGVTVYQIRYPTNRDQMTLPEDRSGVSPESIERARFTTVQSAMIGDWFVIVDGSTNSMRDIIQRHAGNLTNSLKQSALYPKSVQPLDPNSNITLYVGLGELLSGLVDVYQYHMASDPNIGTTINLKGLGVEEIESVALSLSLSADRMQTDSTIVRKANSQGLGKLLDIYGSTCEFKTARFTAEDVLGYSAFAYDLAVAWDAIEGMARRVSPEVGMQLDGVLGMAQMQLGFNPINEIVRNLAGEFASVTPKAGAAATAVPGMMGNQSSPFIIMAETRNGAQIAAALEKIEQTITQQTAMQGGPAPESPIEKTDFLDFKIQTIKAPEGDMSMATMMTFPAWTITDSWIIVASTTDDLKGVLRRVAGREEKHFAGTETFKNILAKAGNRALAGMSYTDVAEMLNDSLTQAQGFLFTASMLSGGAVPPNILDFQSRPDLATLRQHLGPAVGLIWKSPTMITSVTTMDTQ